jgi:hypothetical protein
MRRDRLAGLNTATFISGYEGSPLGAMTSPSTGLVDLLKDNRIHFVPGVNEDIAATSVLGSQIYHVLGESKYDGVVGIWYGKGPESIVPAMSSVTPTSPARAATAAPSRSAATTISRKAPPSAPERLQLLQRRDALFYPAISRKFSTTACSESPSLDFRAPGLR